MADSGTETPNYTETVRAYWEETTSLYLQHGATFQAGFVNEPGQPTNSTANNLFLASRAGIKPGDRVLDAGCGVCGPSIDIARSIPDVKIDAVTLSPSQATLARDAVRNADLPDQVQIHVCDYHDLPFEAKRFDVVFFFESMYSVELPKLLTEVLRVLTSGGRLYAKEVFRMERSLSQLERAALEEFEDLFRYKVRSISEAIKDLAAAGFREIESCDLSPLASTLHFKRAKVEYKFGFLLPTAFGRRHARRFGSVPVLFGELKARKAA